MRYSAIRKMDVSNGCGVGVSLFVQGCHFHCKGCFNQETWDFNGGKEWTEDTEKQFIELANKPYIKRVSILGGEPLANENVYDVSCLLKKIKYKYPDKKIWLYTGYTCENIVLKNTCEHLTDNFSFQRLNCIKLADVVVDGQFQLEKQDLFNKEIVWAGSTNQRVIDTKRSFDCGKIILYDGE